VEDGLVSPKVLGVHIGSNDACNADLERICAKVADARAAIQALDSPCAEVTLQRLCLNVSKASYLLRCQGDRLNDQALQRFDSGMASGLESALWGSLPDDSWHQATLSVDAGGLGMREAHALALPAFLASRAVARPQVAEMAAHCEAAGVCAASLCMRVYDERTEAALARWLATVPAPDHAEVHSVLADAREQSGARWQSWCNGAAASFVIGGADGEGAAAGGGLIADAGTADPEHPRSAVRGGALQVQYLLTRILDRGVASGLAAQFEAQERWGDPERLSDLSHPEASHDWLWAVDPHKGRPLEADEFVMAARLRLGCGGPDDASLCSNCGVAMLGISGEHGLLCAKGESTRGHNCVRDELHSMAKSVDSCAEVEPEGLIPSHPRHRPADVLTSAFHGRLAAVDVGVICPSAAGSGSDCVVTMEQRKRERLAPFRQEMEAGGVEYHPFAVSCWGRLHPSADQMLITLSKRLVRRDGSSTQRAILLRLRCRIATEIMRRAAKMILCCMPSGIGVEEPPAFQADGDISVESSLRAGHPGHCRLPPLYPAPSCGIGCST